uniref:Mitochondrial cytochrome c oxidase subunit VIII-H n=1 Tax=Branchiostoma belcheri tsingtauense TaxID=155462 RepID=Q692Y6_BRABE|nr:mitochondrial cytochrome c oxidase subunit VIII-H [Branchiostoma belcheri tsingtauense]
MLGSIITRGGLGRALLTMRPQIQQRAGIMSEPAKNPMSSTDKAIGATAILAGVMGIPVWILCNLKRYQGKE